MRSDRQTGREMLGEVLDLGVGLSILLLPLLITAVPGVLLLLVAPALLLLGAATIPLLIVTALLAPPWLVLRAFRGPHGESPR